MYGKYDIVLALFLFCYFIVLISLSSHYFSALYKGYLPLQVYTYSLKIHFKILLMWEKLIQISNLIRACVIIWTSTNHEQFAHTAGNCWGTDSFFKWSYLCPSIGKRVITLHATQSILPIISSNHIHLLEYVKMLSECIYPLIFFTQKLHKTWKSSDMPRLFKNLSKIIVPRLQKSTWSMAANI